MTTKTTRFTIEIGHDELQQVKIAAMVCGDLSINDFIRIAVVDHASKFKVEAPTDNPFVGAVSTKRKMGRPVKDTTKPATRGKRRGRPPKTPAAPVSYVMQGDTDNDWNPPVAGKKRRGRPPKNRYEVDIPEDDYADAVDDDLDGCGDPEELDFHD